jgi:hypothetical protein
MELRTYGSQWALPSFDPQCLAAMLILQQLAGRLNKSYSMVDTNDPTEFSSGTLRKQRERALA